MGESFDETRLDLEASIAGDSTENLLVKEVIKQLYAGKKGTTNIIVQKGVVVVESKK